MKGLTEKIIKKRLILFSRGEDTEITRENTQKLRKMLRKIQKNNLHNSDLARTKGIKMQKESLC